jgi:O-antigen/teichoic acid export membrane protein
VADERVSDRPRPSSQGVFASARSVVLTAVREVRQTDLSRRHASDLSWLVTGQAGALALGIVSIKLLTSMGTDAYGRYALALTVAALLSALVFGPAEQGFLRFYYPAVECGSSRIFVGVLYRVLLLGAAALSVVTGIAAVFAWSRSGTGMALTIAAGGAFAVASAGTTPLAAMLNLLGRRRLNAVLQVLERAGVVLALWLLARRGLLSVTTALVAGAAVLVLVSLVRALSVNRAVPADEPMDTARRRSARRDAVRSVASFGAPFAIWGLAGWLQSNSERWIIGTILSTSDVGVFAMMLTIANVLIAYPYGVMAQLFTPATYRRLHDLRDGARVDEGLRLIRVFGVGMVALTVAAACVTLLFGRLAISWLSSPEFAASWYLLPVVCVGAGLFYVGQAVGLVGASLNAPRIYLVPKTLAGLLSVAVNTAAASEFGLPGIAVSSWVIGGVYVALVVRANTRILRRTMPSALDPPLEGGREA